ncbi:MAG TPA: hypothetical protein VEB21_00200 [Terriglobales bacterium]|nr:hypothetical protein [Terriglobales bacterium]
MADEQSSVVAGADTVGNYYRGIVCKLHRGPERGRVRTAGGREIPFTFQHVTMNGPLRHFADLREGMIVGYDVSWTAKGLRVSVIRIPDPTFLSESHRQLRAEQDEPTHHLADEHGEDGDVE